MATCAKCGATIGENAMFCGSCGTGVAAVGETPQTVTSAGAAGSGISSNVAALLSYILWPIVCILFLVLAPYNKDKFVRFHAFQALFLGLAGIGLWIILLILTAILGVIPVIGWVLGLLLWLVFGLGMLGLVIFLMYKAYNGVRYVVPLIGSLAAQKSEKMA